MLDAEQALREARCRVYWGEREEDVRSYLVESGSLSLHQAIEVVRAMVEERNKDARREAAARIVKGLGLVVLSVVMVFGSMMVPGPRYILGKLTALCVIPGVYGFFKITRGIDLWIRPRFRSSV